MTMSECPGGMPPGGISIQRLFGLLLVVALLVSNIGCASHARALRDVQGPQPKISDVTFEGMKRFSKGEMLRYLHVGESSWVPFTRDFHFDPALVSVDARGIEDVYRAHGYYQARVVSVVPVIDREADKATLTIQVQEGEPTMVTSLRFVWADGAEPDEAERRKVEAQASLKQAGPFEVALLNASIGDLRVELLQRGFPLAAVQASADVHEGATRAEVELYVNPGPRAVISAIRFEGLHKVPQYMCDREVQFAIGKRYSPGVTNQMEQSLKAMRVFRWTAVTPPTEVRDGKVVLTVRLSEADPQSITIGPDIAFEAIRWQERLTAVYTHTNLLGNLTRLDFTVVGGYAELPNPWSADRHGPVTKVEPAFTKKGILEPFLVWTLAPVFTSDIREGYSFWTVGDRFGASRWFGGIFNASLTHYLTRFDYFEISPALDRNTTQLGRDFSDPYLLSYGELKGTLHLTDSIARPTNGAVFEALYDMAGGAFFGDYDFHKGQLGVRGYYKPAKRLQFVSRIQGGTMIPYGSSPGVPLSARYYLGGANTVRGFGSRRLSPSLDECTPEGDCTHIPVGGFSMVQATVELRYNFAGPFSVVGFSDMGDVQAKKWTFTPSTWNFTAGPGLRVTTPLGLVRADVGFRLNRLEAYPRESKFAFYVGLGEVF